MSLPIEERRREIEARRKVVREYLDRARERQGNLRRRYKELLLQNDGSDDRSSSDESSSRRKRRYSRGDGSEQVSYDRTNPSKSPSKDSVGGTTKGKEWDAKDSFGSSGRRRRGRGSGRNRYGSTSNPNSSAAPENSSTPYTSSSSERKSPDQQNREPVSTTSTSYVPPHRRILDRSSRAVRNADDKRRLREIKVEEDLEKMKRELGL